MVWSRKSPKATKSSAKSKQTANKRMPRHVRGQGRRPIAAAAYIVSHLPRPAGACFKELEKRMAQITASMVKELREKTDAPMMECKKALTEAEGAMARAEDILRVKLGKQASKYDTRVHREGRNEVGMSGVQGK